MKLPVAVNINTVLVVLGGLGVFVPGIDALSSWLASMNVAWLGTVVRGLGLLAAFCAAAPLAVPKLRAGLAALGMATPPGGQAPWSPTKNPDVVPMVQAPRVPDPDSTNTPAKPMAVPTTTDDAITKDIMPPKGVVIVPPKKPPTDPIA